MRFIMAYSCGKDCTLALEKMMEMGHTPVCLFVLCKNYEEGSVMHDISPEIVKRYEEALGIPVYIYKSNFVFDVKGIGNELKKFDAEAYCTGDIFMDKIKQFNEELCAYAGLKLFMPLFGKDTKQCVTETVEKGYKCLINTIQLKMDNIGIDHFLPSKYLGQYITSDLIKEFEEYGIDVCGENGEYHSIVVDGPIFRKPLDIKITGNRTNNNKVILELE